MSRVNLPKWKQPRRAFEVIALKKFTNYEVLTKYYFISDKMPLPEDINLKPNERIMQTTELRGEVIIK